MRRVSFLISIVVLIVLLSSVTGVAGDKLKVQERLKLALTGTATALSYSPNGRFLAVGFKSGQVEVWDLGSGKTVLSKQAHNKAVNTVQFDSVSERLLTISYDQGAKFLSLADGSEQKAFPGPAFSGALSPNDRLLAAQASDQAVCLWDASTGARIRRLTKSGIGGTRSMSFSKQSLLTAHNSVMLFDTQTGEQKPFAEVPPAKVNIQMTGENKAVISLGEMSEDTAPPRNVVASRESSLVAVVRAWYGHSAVVDIWDLDGMTKLATVRPKDAGVSVSFSHDSKLLAVEGEKEATIWDWRKTKRLLTIRAEGIFQFSPTSAELAVLRGNELLVLAQVRIPQSRWEQAAQEIKRLSPSAFPDLPGEITAYLKNRSCMVPQVWRASEPGNVIAGEFYRPGQRDWAVLCACKGRLSVLVFQAGRTERVDELGESNESSYLQHVGGEEIAFSRAIATVGEAYIVSHYKGGPQPRPIDHAGINDSFVEKGSVVRYWHKGEWLELDGAD